MARVLMVHLHVYLTRTCASGMLALMADSTSTLGVKSLMRETPVEDHQRPRQLLSMRRRR